MHRSTITVLLVLAVLSCATARWLPTRSQDDRLDKLREMLRDLLESEIEKSNYDRRAVFKREVNPGEVVTFQQDTPQKPVVKQH